MTVNLSISQEIDVIVDWKKLADDLKEEFNIGACEDDIEAFCCNNEKKYLIVNKDEQNIDDTYINDLTGDEQVI